MRVTVHVFQAGLVHVLVGVLCSVGVGVGVGVLDMVVFVHGMRVLVLNAGVLVLVRVRSLVAVWLVHDRILP
ncbi:hypothetical protein AWC20_01650 [Mycobacterium parmense]|nr:hypothetical protein AWC20_01650 [Mycobacterium parmense]